MFMKHKGVPVMPQSCFGLFFRLPCFTLVVLASILFVPTLTSAKETDQDTRVAHPSDASKIFRWCLDRVEDTDLLSRLVANR